MEYIFTNLPQYIKITPQSAFSSSIVESGHALLFMPTSSSIMAKLPDGSFITVGGSGTDVSSTTAEATDVRSGKIFYTSGGIMTSGTLNLTAWDRGSTITPGFFDIPIFSGTYFTNLTTIKGDINLQSWSIVSGCSIFGVRGYPWNVPVSDTTVEAADVLSGKIFYNSGGTQTTGTIPTVSASITSGAVVVPSGYIAASQSFPVSGDVDFSSVTAIPSSVLGGEIFIDSAGQFQEGTMPINMGDTITPSTSSQTVSSGQYLAGDVVVEGDAALVASNIVSGVSIFGVSGTYTGADVTLGYVSGGIFYELAFSGTSSVENGSSAGLSNYGWNLPASSSSSGGSWTSSGAVVSNIETVSSGEIWVSTTVSSGGTLYIASGGEVNSTLAKGESWLRVGSGGTANVTELGGNLAATFADMFILNGGIANSVTANYRGSLNVSSGGTANSITVNSSGMLIVSSGGTVTAIMENGGYVHVADGGIATFTPNTFSDLNLYGYYSATIHSGTTAVSATVNSGGYLDVFSGGTANDTIVSSNGAMVIYSGGTANDTIVSSGGSMVIYSGAVASNTTSMTGAVIINS